MHGEDGLRLLDQRRAVGQVGDQRALEVDSVEPVEQRSGGLTDCAGSKVTALML